MTDATVNDNKLLNYVSTDDDVYILGKFDETISQHVVPAFKQLIEKKSTLVNPNITIYINSPGGYCHELYNLLTMIDLAHARGINITTIVMGRAYSCGSMLAIHGDIRLMYKYSTHLIHLGEQGSFVTTEKQIKRETQFMEKHFNNIREMYLEHTKIPKKELDEALSVDSYFLDAEKCLEYGLCDEIIGTQNEEDIDAYEEELLNISKNVRKQLEDLKKKRKDKEKSDEKQIKKVSKTKENSKSKKKVKKEKQILLENEGEK